MVKETRKMWPSRVKFSPHALSISGRSPCWDVGCLLALAGQCKSPTRLPLLGPCLQSLRGTTKPQSRAHHLLHTGLVVHSCKHTVQLVKSSRKCVLRKQRLELWMFLPCPEDQGWVPKITAYSEQCQIPDLHRRRFSFETRNQAWSLKSFCVAEFY